MGQFRIADHIDRIYPMGLTVRGQRIYVSTAAAGSVCRLLLFKKGEEALCEELVFPENFRVGDVFRMTLELEKRVDLKKLEYCFQIDEERFADPYGRAFTGREQWGDESRCQAGLRCPVADAPYDWEGDQYPGISYENCIIYRAHVRGFTRHASSGVGNKGTWSGFQEKIPYLKELGVTTVELLPVNEFEEVVMEAHVEGDPHIVEKPAGKLNYWGYTQGQLFAPKASYGTGKRKSPGEELKDLVKQLHKAGMELVTEMYFTGEEDPSYALDAVRFWVEEYHLDGVHLVGFPPIALIGNDPYLSRTKLWAVSWDGVNPGNQKHLGEYHDGFLTDMRRVLKGDEDQMNCLVFRSRYNPRQRGVINYMAHTNGFTLMDMVSYDTKHNEANGENNQDGTSSNYSWNCGTEGPTRRKKIVDLRKKQLRNAVLLLFLSQGTPLWLAGDEFGNSQNGNNNTYCQDNEVSWLNWKQLVSNHELYEFVKAAIAFRQSHPVLHSKEEPRVMDYRACGLPDVSYHGVKAWCPEFENFRRQLGILYCGAYGKRQDGTEDNSCYVVFNMHWESHQFDLPNLPKGQKWHMAFNTDAAECNGIYPLGQEPLLERKQIEVPARTILVMVGKDDRKPDPAGKMRRKSRKISETSEISEISSIAETESK